MHGSEDIKEKTKVISIHDLICLLIIFGCLMLKAMNVDTVVDQILLFGAGFYFGRKFNHI